MSKSIFSLLFGTLEFIFPQKQSSSGGWLPAWPKRGVFSSQHHSLKPSPLHQTLRQLCQGSGGRGKLHSSYTEPQDGEAEL
jgi:hypothetical protein